MMQCIRKALSHAIIQCSANQISQCTSDSCSADYIRIILILRTIFNFKEQGENF